MINESIKNENHYVKITNQKFTPIMLSALEKVGLQTIIGCYVIPDIASTIVEYYNEKCYELLVKCEASGLYSQIFEIYIDLNSHTARKVRKVLEQPYIEGLMNNDINRYDDNHREVLRDTECRINIHHYGVQVINMSIIEINRSLSHNDKFYILQRLLVVYEKYLATEEDKEEQKLLRSLVNKEIDELQKLGDPYFEYALKSADIYNKYWDMGLITFQDSVTKSFVRRIDMKDRYEG